MEQEIWKPIQGYEGMYEISSLGRVKSLERKVNKVLVKSRLLTHTLYKGYPRVTLSKSGKGKCCKVHRLIAIAFIPNPLNKAYVNHIDGIRDNFSISNLEWVTMAENNKHSHTLHPYKWSEKVVARVNKLVTTARNTGTGVFCPEDNLFFTSIAGAGDHYGLHRNTVKRCIARNGITRIGKSFTLFTQSLNK